MSFFQDEIEFPDGALGTYAYVRRKNGVAVVVVSKNNNILLHKEHRYVINEFSWEVPGGGIDSGETEPQAAKRELQEEAGITVSDSELVRIGKFYPLNSFNTEQISVFMAIVDDEVIRENTTEQGEHLESRQFFTFDEVYSMIDSGKINDAVTACAVQLAIRKVNA